MFKDWRQHEFESVLKGNDPPGRTKEACDLLRQAIADYRKGGKFGRSALSGWMKEYLDKH